MDTMSNLKLPCQIGSDCHFETISLPYEQAKEQLDRHMHYVHGESNLKLPCQIGSDCHFETISLPYEQAREQLDGHMRYAHGQAQARRASSGRILSDSGPSEVISSQIKSEVEVEEIEIVEETASDLVINEVHTCFEVPDSGDDEDGQKQIHRRDVKSPTVEEPGEYIEKEFDVKIDLEKLDVRKKNIKTSNLTLTKEKDTVWKIKDRKKTKKNRLSCKIEGCKAKACGRFKLYQHYSNIHYKRELIQLIAGKKQCPYCNRQFKETNYAVVHVGCVHNRLEDFLPERFHIKKSSKKKPKLASSSREIGKKSGKDVDEILNDEAEEMTTEKEESLSRNPPEEDFEWRVESDKRSARSEKIRPKNRPKRFPDGEWTVAQTGSY